MAFDLKVVFRGVVVHELSEPKRRARYTPPPGLHKRRSRWLLWGWCADCGVRQRQADSRTGSRERSVFFSEFGVLFLEKTRRIQQKNDFHDLFFEFSLFFPGKHSIFNTPNSKKKTIREPVRDSAFFSFGLPERLLTEEKAYAATTEKSYC